MHSPSRPRTILDAGIVAGAGGGIEKTLVVGSRFHESSRYRSILALVHPPSDTGFDTLRTRATRHGAELYERSELFPFSPLTLAWFATLCRQHRIDIWHGHDYKSDVIGLLLQPMCGFSLVCTMHGWSARTSRTKLYFALDRHAIRRYQQVIAVSSDLHAAARRLGVPEERLSLMENGVDAHEYRRRRPPRIGSGTLHIGAAGRLTAEKGFLELISTVEALLDEGLDVRLSIAGEGPQRHALQARIRDSPHASRFVLRGYVVDMQEFYDELDLFCLSSLREGLPNVVLEAMAMCVAVVATDAGGLRTFLHHGTDALLCPAGSLDSLRDTLRAAIRSPELRVRLAQAARVRVEKDCTLARRMEQLFAVYDRLP